MIDKITVIENGKYRIKQIQGNNKIPQRLLDMGVLPGSVFKIIRVGPMGKTLELKIEEAGVIAIRIDELRQINCELIGAPLSELYREENLQFRIKKFEGGYLFKKKMSQRGLKVGTGVEKIDRNHGFHLLLNNGQSVHIGRGEAAKIILETVSYDAG